jgi:hypothetical protein
VSERDRAAVDVHELVGEPQLVPEAQNHRRERLVDLPEIDVLRGHPCPRECTTCRCSRGREHDAWFAADRRPAADSSPGREAETLARLRAPQQHRCGAVHDPGAVARVVYVVDRLELRVLVERDGIESVVAPHLHEGGPKLGEGVQGRALARVFVAIQDGDPVAVDHRHDRPVEAAFAPGLRCPLLRGHRDGVAVGA